MDFVELRIFEILKRIKFTSLESLYFHSNFITAGA